MFRQIMSGARVMIILLFINASFILVSSLKRRPRRKKAKFSDIEASPEPSYSTEDLRIPPGPYQHSTWVKHREERRELLGL